MTFKKKVYAAEGERLARDNLVTSLQLQVHDLRSQLGLGAQAGPAN